MNLERQIYNIATQGASEGAIYEGINSNMPGRENGPADAYRHIILAAELTRRYGEGVARDLLNGHEWTGNLDDQIPAAEAMDRHNNEIGIRVGRDAQSWREILERARSEISAGGQDSERARWLPEDQWKTNPTDDNTGERIPTGDPRQLAPCLAGK